MAIASPMQQPAAPPSPASPPTGNPGQVAVAASKVREGISIIEKALPELQIGSKQHKAVVDAIRSLSKEFPVTDHMPGIQNSTLMGLQRSAKEGGVMQQLMASMAKPSGGAEGAMPPGGAMPPTPAPMPMET